MSQQRTKAGKVEGNPSLIAYAKPALDLDHSTPLLFSLLRSVITCRYSAVNLLFCFTYHTVLPPQLSKLSSRDNNESGSEGAMPSHLFRGQVSVSHMQMSWHESYVGDVCLVIVMVVVGCGGGVVVCGGV